MKICFKIPVIATYLFPCFLSAINCVCMYLKKIFNFRFSQCIVVNPCLFGFSENTFFCSVHYLITAVLIIIIFITNTVPRFFTNMLKILPVFCVFVDFLCGLAEMCGYFTHNQWFCESFLNLIFPQFFVKCLSVYL